MNAKHLDAERRYDVLRQLALSTAQKNAPANIRYTEIDAHASAAAADWNKSPTRQVDWDWAASLPSLRRRHPKRFELALWATSDLIALSFGRPTYNGDHLRLDFVEARPRDLGERPDIFIHVQLAYGIYARLVNAQSLRIMNPINDQVKVYYESFGYVYDKRGDFVQKEIW